MEDEIMCIAIPGKLIEADGRKGKVDIKGNLLNVELGAVNAKKGDTVLVHAGCAISVLKDEEAEEMDELFRLLGELNDEED